MNATLPAGFRVTTADDIGTPIPDGTIYWGHPDDSGVGRWTISLAVGEPLDADGVGAYFFPVWNRA